MRALSIAILLLSSVSCSTKPVVLPDSRILHCQGTDRAPCERYTIDAGYLREIMIRLGDCKK
jgi:hypothetical protein